MPCCVAYGDIPLLFFLNAVQDDRVAWGVNESAAAATRWTAPIGNSHALQSI